MDRRAPPAATGDAQIQADLANTLQANLPGIAAGNTLIAVAVAVGLQGTAPGALLWPWLALQLLHSGSNAWAWWRARQRPAGVRSGPRRLRAAAVSALVSGVLWALALPLLWPADRLDLQMLLIMMITGLTAAAAHSLTHHLPAFYLFLWPNVLAVAGVCVWQAVRGPQGSAVHGLIAATALVYGITGSRFAAGVNAAQVRALRQRDELVRLAADLRAQKAQAEQASLSKSRFLAAASHDLRQPVHALSLFLGALRAQPLPPESQQLVRHANRTVQTMGAMFNALLDMSRLDAGMVQPELQSVALAALLQRIAEQEGTVARAKGLQLKLRLARGTPLLGVRSDPMLLERIVRNLVANAVRYTDRGGVLLTLRRRGKTLLLQVWDTGIGIPADRQAEVFQEFVQLHNPERDRDQGLGLGLAIVRRLAQLLQHPLTLRSVPGRGSMFALSLAPGGSVLPEPQTLAGAPLPTVPAAIRHRLVLVIDDDAEIRAGMQGLLAGWGCEVVVAEGLDSLLPQLADLARVPDLIISDYRLRGDENGLAVVARLQDEYNADIPAILVTGDTAPERLREAAGSGLRLLHKPVQPAELRAAMAAFWQDPRSAGS